MVRQHQPQIVLMDLTMPRINGIEATRKIKSRYPDIKVIILTVHKSEEFVRSTLDSGADGYVLKDDSSDELISAIRQVQQGHTFVSPGIASLIVSGFLDHPAPAAPGDEREPSPRAHGGNSLTSRERQTLQLVAEGYKNKEIAEIMSVSLKTVEKHRANLMRKLKLHSASAITAYAIKHGLLSIDS
jgi:DNA-binding NarL/FixJ family response regulator